MKSESHTRTMVGLCAWNILNGKASYLVPFERMRRTVSS